MSEEDYKKREIDIIVDGLKNQLSTIITQGEKFIGIAQNNDKRITALETRFNTMIWVFGITIPVIISLAVWIFLNQIQSIKEQIPHEVSNILDDYQVELVN